MDGLTVRLLYIANKKYATTRSDGAINAIDTGDDKARRGGNS